MQKKKRHNPSFKDYRTESYRTEILYFRNNLIPLVCTKFLWFHT